MSHNSAKPARKYFHSFRDTAERWSRRGWTTTTPEAEWDELVGLPAGRQLNEHLGQELAQLAQAVFGSVVADLVGIRSLLARIAWLVDRIDSAARDATDPAYDPVANGHKEWLDQALAPPPPPPMWPLPGWLEGLALRGVRAVVKTGCTSPAELAAYGRDRLAALKQVGPVTLREVDEFLQAKHGLRLAGGESPREPEPDRGQATERAAEQSQELSTELSHEERQGGGDTGGVHE